MLFEQSLTSILGANTNMCLSGGAEGADLQWGLQAGIAGHNVIHWSFEGHRSNAPESELVQLTQEQLNLADGALEVANSSLNRRWPSKTLFTNNLLRRNWYQIKEASAVYAVSDVSYKTGISGGTAWAVQMYLDRFTHGGEDAQTRQVYVLDKFTGHWYTFNGTRWVIMNSRPPTPSGIWAGIGSRELAPKHRIEIRKLMGTFTESMIRQLHPIVEEPNVDDIIYIPAQRFANSQENTAGGWATIRRITNDGKHTWVSVTELYQHNEFKWSDLVDAQIELRDEFKNVRAYPKPE